VGGFGPWPLGLGPFTFLLDLKEAARAQPHCAGAGLYGVTSTPLGIGVRDAVRTASSAFGPRIYPKERGELQLGSSSSDGRRHQAQKARISLGVRLVLQVSTGVHVKEQKPFKEYTMEVLRAGEGVLAVVKPIRFHRTQGPGTPLRGRYYVGARCSLSIDRTVRRRFDLALFDLPAQSPTAQ
jgi:hypothetical protein